MKNYLKMTAALLAVSLLGAANAFAVEAEGGSGAAGYAIAALMGLAVLGGTFGQSRAIASALESMGRNPAAAGKIQIAMLLGLAFIESLVIFGLAVVFVKF
jgi:F-type H+-transporting ATPase subunit c